MLPLLQHVEVAARVAVEAEKGGVDLAQVSAGGGGGCEWGGGYYCYYYCYYCYYCCYCRYYYGTP
jgi:hypothetical protein